MAAMFTVKNAMFTLSKAFPQTFITLRSSPKVSRVFFATFASKYGGTNQYGNFSDSRADMDDKELQSRKRNDHDALDETMAKAKGYANETRERANDGAYRAAEAAEDMTERAKHRAKEGADRVSEAAYNMKDKTMDYGHDAKEKTKEGAQRAAEATSDATERAKEQGRGMMDKTADVVGDVAGKATDTVKSMGEKAKETAQGAWDATKGATRETTKKVKETVVGKDEDTSDEEEVVEFRRRVGGSDHDKKY